MRKTLAFSPAAMTCPNLVPKFYRSVIEDVIERVQHLFAEEGVEEQVLKELKQLWETKVLQSKATEDFRNSIPSPLSTFQLPHGLHQSLQTSTASLVIPAGRAIIPSFNTAELGSSNSSANFAFPSAIGYPIHVPAGMFQAASGHLYNLNMPVIVTQTVGRTGILQHPVQQIFHQLGPPSVIQTSVPQLSPSSLHANPERAQRLETVFQQPTILHPGTVDGKHVGKVNTDIFVPSGSEHTVVSEAALLCGPESPQYVSLPRVVLAQQVSPIDSDVKSVLGVSPHLTQNLPGGSFTMSPQSALHQATPVLKNRTYGYDSAMQARNPEDPSSLPASEKDPYSQMDLSISTSEADSNEIIQIDGPGDTSSNEETGSAKDVDENEFYEIVSTEDLKLLEEESGSLSNEDSALSSDTEDPEREIVEEDPLNSGDDVSEQDIPDLFDTDNVIVCRYDKIHRNKNKWKFYLKDGVMCFGGKDYVFSKAIGDAEW
ncbi:PREDICTED: TFIIA-alpha and beta-like factor [Elephantulus edwardii]|uniref:TFIIA-alpha and beta-like factor n=1 Tax=Elephantulus edwardii TaxID=28737 RepID=UPI0003F0E6BB|nr:PREDICTED: TFIIA-alpha and beta-like factor [Elephantulus edwardii]